MRETGVTLGVDAGSRTVKLAAMEGGRVVFSARVDTIAFYLACRNGGRELDITRLPELAAAPAWGRVVTTGYGRNSVPVKEGRAVPEIMAHVKGAVFQTGLKDFTLVDLGGQDTKVVSVRGGEVDDFIMNDKCAAGSGRYLENLAAVLGQPVERLGECAEDPLPMSNTCAIFGESEAIGLVADGEPVERILAGANRSVVMRLTPMIRKHRPGRIVATGGVALNRAVLAMLGREAGVEVITPAEPQLNGAIGCCLY